MNMIGSFAKAILMFIIVNVKCTNFYNERNAQINAARSDAVWGVQVVMKEQMT